MVDVVFLGTGGAFSSGRRSPLALLIESGNFRMLVESGPMIVEQLARVNLLPADIRHLFVSHYHGDHTLGFPMLVLNRLTASTRLHVYAGHSTAATLEMLWALAFPSFGDDRLTIDYHRLSERDLEERDLSPGIILSTTIVPHPPGVPTLAARWDFEGTSVTLATDTLPNALTLELARGSDLLIHEASFSATLQPDANSGEHFHSTAQQAGEIARRAGCARLALVHMGPEISEHPDVLVEEAQAGTGLEVIVPEDGERVRVCP
jgi:ribonuclease Z